MHLKSNHFLDAHCRRTHSTAIEKKGDHVLVIRDIPTGPNIKALLWIMSGFILVVAVLSVITSQNVTIALMFIVVLLAALTFMVRRTNTEINLAGRTIMVTWETGFYARQKVYSLDDFLTAEIYNKGQIIEGYSLPIFYVQLVGRRKHITIYSTDDPEDAKSVQGEIIGFMSKAGISTQQQQSG